MPGISTEELTRRADEAALAEANERLAHTINHLILLKRHRGDSPYFTATDARMVRVQYEFAETYIAEGVRDPIPAGVTSLSRPSDVADKMESILDPSHSGE